MIEVEIKLPVLSLEAVKIQLLALGFQEIGFEKERDTYFDNALGMIRAADGALRVRETEDGRTGSIRSQINYKGKRMDARTMTRQELETGVENGEICRNILRALGYFPVEPEVVKERVLLRQDTVTACLDRVRGLGEFLELETLTEREEDRADALERIERILKELGYQLSDTLRISYLSMLQRKQSAKGGEKWNFQK